jgi:hypothetical protein
MRLCVGLLFFDTGDLPPPQHLYHHCQHPIPQHQHALPALVLRKRAMPSPVAAAQASHAAAACTCNARSANIKQHGIGEAKQHGQERCPHWLEAKEAVERMRSSSSSKEGHNRGRGKYAATTTGVAAALSLVLSSKATATASEARRATITNTLDVALRGILGGPINSFVFRGFGREGGASDLGATGGRGLEITQKRFAFAHDQHTSSDTTASRFNAVF